MFTIEWIKKNGAYGTVDRMACPKSNLDDVVEAAKALFPGRTRG